MTIYKFKDFDPNIEQAGFIAKDCSIIGDVTLGKNVNVWFQTVLRGDVAPISIGDNTNVQDLSMLHVAHNGPLVIGKNVTIGHKVTLHACTIGDSCLIGMDSVVLDFAQIGENCVVGAGSVVTPGKVFPPRSLIIGSPAKVVRELTEDEISQYGNHYSVYLDLAKEYQLFCC